MRTSQDPMLLATSVTGTLHSMEAEAPVGVRRLEDVVGGTIARPRAIAVLVGVFALLALALAAVGVYGVSERRTPASAWSSARPPCRCFASCSARALRLVIVGVAAVLVAAGALTRLLERLLYQVEPLDPWTFGITALLLLVVAAVASYVPARRGMQMTPADALRTN